MFEMLDNGKSIRRPSLGPSGLPRVLRLNQLSHSSCFGQNAVTAVAHDSPTDVLLMAFRIFFLL